MSVSQDYARAQWTDEDIAPEQTELATSVRVPLLRSPYPRWNYVTGIVVNSELWFGAVPTDDEVRMVGSFCDEYRAHWYNPGFVEVMAELAPYDIDGGANLAYFRKRPEDGGWTFRKRTWRMGPMWVPPPEDQPAALVDVMDRIHSLVDEVNPRWRQWKADHADVFKAAS